VENWPGGRGERGGGCGGCAVGILAPQGRGCFGSESCLLIAFVDLSIVADC